MRTVLLLALLMTSAVAHSEMLNCTLDAYETADAKSLKSLKEPIKSMKGETIMHHLSIAGLGSKKVLVKGDIYPLNSETRIYPGNTEWQGPGESDFYYVRYGTSFIVIELPPQKKDVRRPIKVTFARQTNTQLSNYVEVGSCE